MTRLFCPRTGRTRPTAPRPRRARLELERLEDRSLLSGGPLLGGVTPSLVALKGATPVPIPGGSPVPNTPEAGGFGGPDVHQNFLGPADAAAPFGNEPNSITDFLGVIGAAHIQGSGQDGQGHTLFYDADLRFMQGVYRGVDGELHTGTFTQV